MRRAIIVILLLIQIAIGAWITIDASLSEAVARHRSWRFAAHVVERLEALDAIAEEHPSDREMMLAVSPPIISAMIEGDWFMWWLGLAVAGSATGVLGLLAAPHLWPALRRRRE